MSEVVSIIASSAAIAKVILELQQKFQTIRDAPAKLRSLLDESKHVNDQLSVLAQQQNEIVEYILPDRAWQSCQMFCQRTADELTFLLDKLSGDLDKNRWYGAIRIAFKSDELDRRRQKLEGAKLNLVLAQQSLNSYE